MSMLSSRFDVTEIGSSSHDTSHELLNVERRNEAFVWKLISIQRLYKFSLEVSSQAFSSLELH